jgi:hypothetical protein
VALGLPLSLSRGFQGVLGVISTTEDERRWAERERSTHKKLQHTDIFVPAQEQERGQSRPID